MNSTSYLCTGDVSIDLESVKTEDIVENGIEE